MIIQNNNLFHIGSYTGSYDKLPLGTYRLKQDPRSLEFYLQKIEDFVLPPKVYGETKHIDRILNTFNDSTKNLSVLLGGTKGAGKTIDAKQLCVKSGRPVIIIDERHDGSDFISFMASPELGRCVVLIDEYEKIYTDNLRGTSNTTTILQLLDGACNSAHLFILTVNNLTHLNDNLINRPSRIFYRKLYDGVSDEIIQEILDAELIDQSWRSEMLEVLSKFSTVTFDIIMALVKEVNRYDESPIECAKLMNFTPQTIYVKVSQVHPDGTRRDTSVENLNFTMDTVEVRIFDDSSKTSDFDWRYVPLKELVKVSKDSWIWKTPNDKGVIEFTKTSPIALLF